MNAEEETNQGKLMKDQATDNKEESTRSWADSLQRLWHCYTSNSTDQDTE